MYHQLLAFRRLLERATARPAFAYTLPVRNELVVATGLLGAVSLAWEIRENRPATADTRRHYVLAYGIPMGIVALLALWFHSHSRIQFPALWADLAGKHTVTKRS